MEMYVGGDCQRNGFIEAIGATACVAIHPGTDVRIYTGSQYALVCTREWRAEQGSHTASAVLFSSKSNNMLAFTFKGLGLTSQHSKSRFVFPCLRNY